MRTYRVVTLVALAALTMGAKTQAQVKPPRLATEEDHKKYLSFLPKTNDKTLTALYKKDLMFYTNKEIPSAFQHGGGVFASKNNFSAAATPGSYPAKFFGGAEPFGNANQEFPWGGPAGSHDSPNVKSIRFAYFPNPVVYWKETLKGDDRRNGDGSSYDNYCWEFADGTVFAEILLVTDPKGFDWTFELRTRTKSGKTWTANAYRPYLTPSDLAAAVKKLPNWGKSDKLAALHKHLTTSPKMTVTLLENPHPVTIIATKSANDPLPEIDPGDVQALLNTEFKSALGQEWRTQDKVECHAPTTEAAFHIVPTKYRASHVAVSSKSCMQCHSTVQGHADDYHSYLIAPTYTSLGTDIYGKDILTLKTSGTPRDWYGRVRGSDAIFSFHIFQPSCINVDRGSTVYERVIRPEFVRTGLLKRWRRD